MNSEKRGAFFKYLSEKVNDNSDFINKLSTQVECAKTNADFRRQIMTLEQEIQIREKAIAKQVAEQVREETWAEAWNKASEQTREETQIETARKMLDNGTFPIPVIAEISGLSVERINELAAR